MKTSQVTVVRIYLTEGKHQLEQLLALLHDEEKVCGVTAFRGIAGFGRSGKMHSSSLLDMSLDLPLVVEFYDRPEKVATVLEHLNTLIQPGHIISWPAHVNSGE
jgi:PII-like signaling protein